MKTKEMTKYVYSGIIDSNDHISENIYLITVMIPGLARVYPGQFFMIQISSANDPLLRRPFSVYRITDKNKIQFLFRKVGKGTEILSSLKKGDSLSVVGPLGNSFTISESKENSLCLVGGGMGVAPLFFLAEHALRINQSAKITVLLGAKNKKELLIANDFRSLGVHVEEISDDGSSGRKGFVNDLFHYIDLSQKWIFYGCGPEPMLRSLAMYCRQNSHTCQVSLETAMACGFGACLGCVIPSQNNDKFFHVCMDGPVFKLEDLPW